MSYKQFSTRFETWCFRGEGNQNIVIAIPRLNQVLRLTKQSDPAESPQEEGLTRNEKLRNFSENLMMPLLGKSYIPSIEIVQIPSDDILDIINKIQSSRTEYRKRKPLMISNSFGLLLRDCASLSNVQQSEELKDPTLALEIKPKMGFILANSLQCCRYSLMQKKKLREGKIISRSTYCPLDLFSGCPVRMKFAVEALIENPQNNFRLFQNGNLVYSENSDVSIEDILEPTFVDIPDNFQRKQDISIDIKNRFCDLVVKALCKGLPEIEEGCVKFHEAQKCSCIKNTREHICSNCQSLPVTSILGCILKAQKLDTLGIKKIADAYSEFVDLIKDIPSHVVDGWLYTDSCLDFTDSKLTAPQQELVQKIRDFLISSTSKDCSVMISFCRVNKRQTDHPDVIYDSSNCPYLMQFSILDLDMKPHHRILKYFKDEEELTGRIKDESLQQ